MDHVDRLLHPLGTHLVEATLACVPPNCTCACSELGELTPFYAYNRVTLLPL